MDGGERRRDTRAALGALLLHGAAIACLVWRTGAPLHPLPPPAPQPEPVTVLDEGVGVDFDDLAPREARDAPGGRAVAVAEARPGRVLEPVPAPIPSAMLEPRRLDHPGASATRAPEPPGEASGSPPSLVRPSLGLQLGGANAFAVPGGLTDPLAGAPGDGSPPPAEGNARPHAPSVPEAKRAAETALRAPARERERELGLGPEGPILGALGEATYASAAPVKGKASFLAIADAAGVVISIEVLGCDGSRTEWSAAAASALAALRGKKLRMPSSAQRSEMTIDVVSEWKLPTGRDPGVDVDLLHLPLKKGEGPSSTKVSLIDPIPKVRVDMLEVSPGVKVPIVSVSVDLLSIQGDPADIGAKPRRIVHTRLRSSKVL